MSAKELRELFALHQEGVLTDEEFATAKGRVLGTATPQGSMPRTASVRAPRPDRPPSGDLANESEYYRAAFEKIGENGGRFTGSWNWAAFFFGTFWYLYKGMWAKALIAFAIVFFTLPFGVMLWLPLTCYCAICGNYDYYLLKVRGTQLWNAESH